MRSPAMVRKAPILVALLTIIMQLQVTEANDPSLMGNYVESSMFSLYVVPRRTIPVTSAIRITTHNVRVCTCKNACFVVNCQAFSVVKHSNGSAECRLSNNGPEYSQIEENPYATYFYRKVPGVKCSMVSLAVQNKTLTFPQDLMEDVALKKNTYSSTEYAGVTLKANANDGNDTTVFLSSKQMLGWLTIDFGAKRTIFHVRILPRQDCCSERFNRIKIYLGDTLQTNGDFSTHNVIYYYGDPYTLSKGWLLITCNGISGRYLSVQHSLDAGTEYLEIVSVEAYALKGN